MSIFNAPTPQYEVDDQRELRTVMDSELTRLSTSSGSYLPTITSSGGGETVTYTTRLGQWVRSGSRMWFGIEVTLATKSGGSGNIQVSLPAPTASIMNTALGVEVDNMAATWTGAPMALIVGGVSMLLVRELSAGAAVASWAKLGATGTIRISGSYLAA